MLLPNLDVRHTLRQADIIPVSANKCLITRS
jgi:hypothetical protein